MKTLAQKIYKQFKSNSKIMDRRNYGTPELVKDINQRGLWCTRNFSEVFFETGYKLEGPQMRRDIVVGDASCFGCPVACGKRSYVASEKYGPMRIEGPEFETIGLLGPNCGVGDWEHIVRATQICDDYGFDTMNAGGCVALAMECFEKGIIGLNMDEDSLNSAAERIINLERLYNSRLGVSRKDDTLPQRFLKESMIKGNSAGETIELDPMLDEYYDIMGWSKDGLPPEEKNSHGPSYGKRQS